MKETKIRLLNEEFRPADQMIQNMIAEALETAIKGGSIETAIDWIHHAARALAECLQVQNDMEEMEPDPRQMIAIVTMKSALGFINGETMNDSALKGLIRAAQKAVTGEKSRAEMSLEKNIKTMEMALDSDDKAGAEKACGDLRDDLTQIADEMQGKVTELPDDFDDQIHGSHDAQSGLNSHEESTALI